MMLYSRYDLFLTANGVVLVFDDFPTECFTIVDTFPHLSNNIFNPSTGHTLPREVQYGSWRPRMTPLQKNMEYSSSDEISKYLDDNGELVEFRVPRNIVAKRRETAWEFMGQEPPAKYISCINKLFEGTRAETSSGSASAEVVDVEAEISTMNNLEVQAVKIISEPPWHLWQSGVLTLRGLEGQKINNQFNEAVIVIREFWKMSESQQKTLMSEGIRGHIWEKCPLAGHSVFFMTRAWEIGRMSAYVKNFASTEDKVALDAQKKVGWLRDIPVPHEPQDDSPESLERSVIEKNKYMKDEGEVRMFQLFAEGIQDLYTGMVENFVRATPALWDEFAMRRESRILFG